MPTNKPIEWTQEERDIHYGKHSRTLPIDDCLACWENRKKAKRNAN